MKLGDESFVPIPAQAFVRDQGAGKAMMLVVIDTQRLPDCIPEHGMFVLGNLTLSLNHCFDPGDMIRDLRADQILCRPWCPGDMTPIDP